MRYEIGSEFWEVHAGAKNDLFPRDTQWFLSGRSALQTIVEQSAIRSVALPSWCCDSMIRPFLDAGVFVEFYPVYFDGGLVQDISRVKTQAILVMDYFGYTGQVNAMGFDGLVIRDVTHSLLSKTYDDAKYYFGSLRKWAGFLTGGYGWGMEKASLPFNEEYTALRAEAMREKQRYITGETGDKGFLQTFAAAEQLLEECAPAGAAVADVVQAHHLDVASIKARRRENAARLLESLSELAIFPTIGQQDCPMFVPILVPDGKRDALRHWLIERQIYCPVHWPESAYHRLDEQTEKLYKQELSLVCDQRYTVEDMDRIIKAVKEFWRG